MIVQTARSAIWRAGFTTVLLWGMAIGMAAQLAISVLAPFIIADLGISRTQLGLLSMVYFAVGAAGSLIAGPLVDRLGGRRMMIILFVVGGASLAALSASSSIIWLLVIMGLAGVATAISNPVTNQLVAMHLPRGLQGMTIGIKQAGVGVATLIAGTAYPWLALAIGWRDAVLLSALLATTGIIGALIVLPISATKPIHTVERGNRWRGQPSMIWWLAVYAFLMGTAGSVTIVFLVLYGVEAVSLSPAVAGSTLALMGAVGICARIVWGHIAERLTSPISVLRVLAVLAAISQLLIWAAATVGPWSLWAGVVLYGASAMGWNSVVMVTVVREVGVGESGTASGIVQAAFYGGYVASPVIFGWVADQAGGYGFGWATVAGISLLAALHTTVWRSVSHVSHPPNAWT